MKDPHILTRQASIEDLHDIVPLFDAYRQFYGRPSDCAAATVFLRERLFKKDSILFVAQDTAALQAGRLVGFAQVYISLSSIGLKPAWILNDLYVLPSVRSRGVGFALAEAASAHAVAENIKIMRVVVQKDNPAARKLYEKLGYQRDNKNDHYALHIG